MRTENTAPVSLADGQAVVDQLWELYERSEHNDQGLFALVFQMAGQSLSDNLAMAADVGEDDAEL